MKKKSIKKSRKKNKRKIPKEFLEVKSDYSKAKLFASTKKAQRWAGFSV